MGEKRERPDYGNWVPANMMKMLAATSAVPVLGTIITARFKKLRPLTFILGAVSAVCVAMTAYMGACRKIFASDIGKKDGMPDPQDYIHMEGYDGVMGRIHHFLVSHLGWDGRGKLLDIGCGAGALTIRCAKKYPEATCVGMDYWGKEWSYAKSQCMKNAELEGVADRVGFLKGDAAKLEFADETFDCAVSNFVFHEVKSQPDKPKLIKEALRVVKKGGYFAFQDLFCQKELYGDMNAVIEELKEAGISEIHYIPDVEKTGFIPRFVQAKWMISGIGLIYGRK